MKSGQYVYVETSGHAKKVAKNYGVTMDESGFLSLPKLALHIF
jgi:hypothetical protein